MRFLYGNSHITRDINQTDYNQNRFDIMIIEIYKCYHKNALQLHI